MLSLNVSISVIVQTVHGEYHKRRGIVKHFYVCNEMYCSYCIQNVDVNLLCYIQPTKHNYHQVWGVKPLTLTARRRSRHRKSQASASCLYGSRPVMRRIVRMRTRRAVIGL